MSPLSSPHAGHKHRNRQQKKADEAEIDTNRLNTNVFYDALHQEFNKKMDSVLSGIGNKSRPMSSGSNLKAANSSSYNDLYRSVDFNHNAGGVGSSKFFNLDEENRRLLIKIIREKELEKQRNHINMHRPVRLTSAALNRQREQQRIEQENQKILKRLLQVKASKLLSKDEQMKDYERNFGIASLNYTRSAQASRAPSAGGFRSGFTSSATSLSNKLNHSGRDINSRASSAKSTTSKGQINLAALDANELLKHAAKLSQKRPEWTDRW